MSRMPGAVFVAKLEHLCKYFSNRRQGVELPALDLVEQPAQLRIIRDRTLQAGLRPSGGDREDLPREIVAPLLLEQALGLEKNPVLLDLLPQLRHVLAASRVRKDDRRPPR